MSSHYDGPSSKIVVAGYGGKVKLKGNVTKLGNNATIRNAVYTSRRRAVDDKGMRWRGGGR